MKKTNFKLSFVASWVVALSIFVALEVHSLSVLDPMLLRIDALGLRALSAPRITF